MDSTKMMIVAVSVLGMLFTVMGAGGLVAGRIPGLLFLLVGLLLDAIAVTAVVVRFRDRRRRARILRSGIPVAARVTGIREDCSAHVNGQHPVVIEAQGAAPDTGELRAFASDPVWVDPAESYPIGSEVTVYCLPGDPNAYAFLLDRLPSPAESIPSGTTKLEGEVPIPDSVEIENIPEGTRYLLPHDTAILLTPNRLKGWSVGRQKCSVPARRVRRMLVWSMGIWVECGWRYPMQVLVTPLLPAHHFDPRVVAAVALDIARRLRSMGASPVVFCPNKETAIISAARPRTGKQAPS